MARSPQVQKDKIRRKTFLSIEKNYRLLKYQYICEHLPEKIRQNARQKLALLNPKGFRVRIKNRCVETGKSRGLLRKFGMSQTSVRMLARSGSVPGMKKASWLLFFFMLLW